jgi:hypothetical protein
MPNLAQVGMHFNSTKCIIHQLAFPELQKLALKWLKNWCLLLALGALWWSWNKSFAMGWAGRGAHLLDNKIDVFCVGMGTKKLKGNVQFWAGILVLECDLAAAAA